MLFRSVDLRLPPAELGWDVGTFEFISDKITSTFAPGSGKVKLKLRTGGSSAIVKREQCTQAGDGLEWDISGTANNNSSPRLPVRYRHRSPVFFEFHQGVSHRHPEYFASVWLQELVDGEEREVDVPVWGCSNGTRLSQNFVTQANVAAVPDLDAHEVGRLRFRARFKPGTDRDHLRFVGDNDSRETIETWEACFAEGVRQEEVRVEVAPSVRRLH